MITLKEQLEGRLQGIGYKEGDYIKFVRLLKILKSLRYVYIVNEDKNFSVLIGHENKDDFPRDVRIVSIAEGRNCIWSLGVGYIPNIDVVVAW